MTEWESGMDVCTLPGVEWTAGGGQPHSTGRSARCFVTAWRGGMGRLGGGEMQEGRDVRACVYV